VGCSSGEVVYSIAIALQEYLSQTASPAKVQIFGTDLIDSNIQKARAAIYPEASVQGLSPKRLRRFFTRVAGGYRIARATREMCIFERHDLATDHPSYSRMELICCRNLSADFRPDFKKKVLNSFHYALKANGFLILDQAKSATVDGRWYPLADCKVPVYCKSRAEADLRISQQELRQLSAKLLTAAEEQRKEVARELHDAFGPRLAKLNLKVAEVEGLLSRRPQFARKLREIGKEISDLVKAAHDLSHSLHPAAVSQLGLAAVLEAECIGFSQTHGIAVDFSATAVPASLPEGITFCLYRVAQEGLQNIRRHARTKKAWVSVAGSHDGIVMVIKDLGKGFDVKAVRGAGGLGLVSMEERVRMVKGSLSIDSKPGEGTRIKVCVPLSGA
jgi:signal transduction histidine kinase